MTPSRSNRSIIFIALTVALALFGVSGAGLAAQTEQVSRYTLENGMTVVSRVGGNAGGLSSACLFVRVGSAYEDPEKSGVTNLLNHMALACQPSGGAVPPALKIEQLGGKVWVETSFEYTCFKLAAPSKNFPQALKALAEAVSAPACSDAALAVERDALASGEGGQYDDRLVEKAYREFLKKRFGDSGYGLYPDGDESALESITGTDARGWHVRRYQPEAMLLSVYGPSEEGQLKKAVNESFGRMSSGVCSSGRPALGARGQSSCGRTDLPAPKGGAAAVIGYASAPPGAADYPAMLVAGAIVSDGMASKMFRGLREDNDLAYSFGGLTSCSAGGPHMAFYVCSDEGRVEPAVDCVRRSVNAVKSGDITADEFARAKGTLIGELSFMREGAVGQAFSAGYYEFMGLGFDYPATLAREVARLGKSDVVGAASRRLDTGSLVVLKAKEAH